jgi:hypothetical protein
MKTAQALEVKLEAVERYERDVKLRLAFRFGVITMAEATQAVVRARISLADGRGGTGVAAEMLAPKWFDKNAGLSDGQNLDQLRQAIDLAGASTGPVAWRHRSRFSPILIGTNLRAAPL